MNITEIHDSDYLTNTNITIINSGMHINVFGSIIKPIDNVEIQLDINVTSNGKEFRPLMNLIVDVCDFLKRPKLNFVFNAIYMHMIGRGSAYFTKCPVEPVKKILKPIKLPKTNKKKMFK